MLDAVIDALTEHLTGGGINAVRRFPEAGRDCGEDIVCIEAKGCRSLSAGFADYVGEKTMPNGEVAELYGRRIELTAGLEAFSPTAQGCTALADSVSALLMTLPEGLRAPELCRGEVSYDKGEGAFRCELRLICTAFFIAQSSGDEEEFLDFVLKGRIENAD